MAIRFTSKRGPFNAKHNALVNMIQERMAMDIEVAIKTTAGTPVKTGGMKAETRHFRSSNGWRVEMGKSYTAYQERGARADGSHRVRKYTTIGTSSGFFMRAIESTLRKKRIYIEEARKAVGL